MMKITLSLINGLLLLLFSSNITVNALQTIKNGYLKVGVHNYASCATYEFFTYIAQDEGLKLQLRKDKNLDNVANDMKNRVFDVSAHGLSNINKSAPLEALASKPYMKVMRGFTVLKKSAFSHSKKLPQGARVAVMNNSTALEDIQKNYPPKFFLLTKVDRIDGSTRSMLRTGKIDAISEGDPGFWFNPDDAKDLVMIDTHPLYANNPDAESLVFWVQPHEKKLLKIINNHLDKTGNIYRYYQQVCGTNYVFPD